MLKQLRHKGVAKKIIWFVVIIIIISFGFLGTAYLFTDSGGINVAGKIFGKNIKIDKFQRVSQLTRINALIRYGEKFSEIQPFLNLDNETWDRLILMHDVKRKKIQVKDGEVIKSIEQNPLFLRNGQFDQLLYNDILRYSFKIRARNFEESTRDSIKFAKLYQMVTNKIQIDEEEIKHSFKQLNEKIQVSYILISPDNYIDENMFNDEAAKQYYEVNKSNFNEPESVNVQYISLEYPSLPEINEDENVQAEEQTIKQKTSELAEIKSQQKAIKEKAQAIAEELSNNTDIAKVSEQFEVEFKESGFFSAQNPNLDLGFSFEILQEIFTLAENQVSAPFESSNKLHIIKVKEKKESHIPDYETAKKAIKKAFLREAAKEITKDKAKEYLKQIKNELDKTMIKDFVKASKLFNLDLHQTPFFSRGQYLPDIGISKEFQDTAFTLNEDNKISDVIEISTGYCVLHLDSYEPADEKSYAEQKENIQSNLLNQKRNQVFNKYHSRLKLEANLLDNVSKLREQSNQQ